MSSFEKCEGEYDILFAWKDHGKLEVIDAELLAEIMAGRQHPCPYLQDRSSDRSAEDNVVEMVMGEKGTRDHGGE